MMIEGETLRSSKRVPKSQFELLGEARLGGRRTSRSVQASPGMKLHEAMLLVVVVATMAGLPVQSRSQSLDSSEGPSATAVITTRGKVDLTYVQPTERTKVNNYIFDAFGPYPIAGAGILAGINQWTDSPPEWGQGSEGFGKRFGSDLAIAAVGTTTRYGLAEAFREDTLYYRCECAGPFPRLRHAILSTLTGRRGDDGHRVFSFFALVAPYAGSMTAVYGWYPKRFGVKDAFRMGNYGLPSYIGGNIALEFFYSGPHALISRMHLNNAHGALDQGPNR